MNVKFRMPRFFSNAKTSGMFKELLMTFIATTLSIVLTFGTAHWLDERAEEKARKILAMTVIYDIDESIEVIKRLIHNEEDGCRISRYLIENIDSLDNFPFDTLIVLYEYTTNGSYNTNTEFNKSNENVFSSSQESWSTLKDRTFISNVQNFYHIRAALEKVMKEWVYFQKPVTDEELYRYMMSSTEINTKQGFLTMCRELLNSPRVRQYIETSNQRVGILRQLLDRSIDLNENNKFLMNITDEDMQEFVDVTIKKVHRVSEKDLIGTWEGILTDDQSCEYEFRKDHTFTSRFVHYWAYPAFYGKMAIKCNMSGKWYMENDSLVNYFDVSKFKMEVDDSGISYQPEMADSIRKIKEMLMSDDSKASYLNDLGKNPRQPRATNVDRTGMRLELTSPEGKTTHYQRKKEIMTK